MLVSASGTGGYGWWLVGGGLMFVCMAMMMMLMMSRGWHGSQWFPFCGMGGRHEHERHRPEETLAERLASGEIDTDEYQRRVAVLRETTEVGKPA